MILAYPYMWIILARRITMTKLKNVGLFFASPFIALAYIIALPIVGLYMFVNLAMEKKGS